MRLPALALLVAVTGTLPAQASAPSLTLVPEARFEVGRVGQAREVVVAVAADGRVITTTRTGADLQAFDAAGKAMGWKLTTGRRDEAEIMYPTAIGWLAGSSTVWVADVGFHQVALVDATGKILKSIEHPSWIHPHWADRRKYPVFASMEALAMYPDHSMLIAPGRERSFIDVPGYDRTMRHLLRVSASGAIERTVASLPLDDPTIPLKFSQCRHTVVVPFAARTQMAVNGDGSRIVIVDPTVPADGGTYRVTALGEKGDTLFSRRYPQPAMPIPQVEIDQYLARIQDCGSTSAAKIRELATMRIPAFRSFVTAVATGSDGSTAVTMRALPDSVHDRVVQLLDAHGETIGTTRIPLDHAIAAVSRDHLWIVEPGKGPGPGAVVRYRLDPTGARPSRTVPVSVSSRPSHPPA